MAFSIAGFTFDRAAFGTNTGQDSAAIHKYKNTSDTIATITAANYFNYLAQTVPSPSNPISAPSIAVGDLIYVKASDETSMLQITAITSTTVTVATAVFPLGTGAVTTDEIANGAVTLPKLATAVSPSHVVKFGGQFTTVGGDATEQITVTGAAPGDIAAVLLVQQGATPRTILTGFVVENRLDVVFSGDPSSDHILQYQIFRATS